MAKLKNPQLKTPRLRLDGGLSDFDTKWRREVLPNGLTFVHLPLAEDARFYFGVCIKSGTTHEPKNRNGLAHFLEHMMFRGSSRFPSAKKLASAFEWLGGEWNAATGYEHTEYWYSGSKRYWAQVIELFAEFLSHPLLQDIAIERDIIKRELSKETNEQGFITDPTFHLHQRFWPKSSFDRLIVGTESSLNAISLDDLKEFRRKNYTPDQMILVCVGDIPWDELKAHVSKQLSAYPLKKTRAKRQALPQPKTANGPFVTWVPHSDSEYTVQLSYAIEHEWHRDALLSQFLCRLLTDGYSAYLSATLREKLGLVYDIQADTTAFSHAGSLEITASVAGDQLELYLNKLEQLLQNLVNKGIKATDVKRIKLRALLDIDLIRNEPEALAYRWAWNLLHDKTPSLQRAAERLQSITAEELHDFVKRTIKASKRNLIIIGPAQPKLEAAIRAKWA